MFPLYDKFGQQRLGFLQVLRIKAFNDPLVDQREESPGFDLFALLPLYLSGLAARTFD